MRGGPSVLVALGEDHVVLEDDQPGVAVVVEKGIDAELGRRARPLQRPRLGGLLHAARRVQLVHAAVQVDDALGLRDLLARAMLLDEDAFVGSGKRSPGNEKQSAKQLCLF